MCEKKKKKQVFMQGCYANEYSVWVSLLATKLPQTRHRWFYIPWAQDRSKLNLSFFPVAMSELIFANNCCIDTNPLDVVRLMRCKSRPSQNELYIPWKELDLFAWGRQSSKLVWYESTKNFCFSFPEICRSNVAVHLRTVISLFNVNYKLLYISIFVCKEL